MDDSTKAEEMKEKPPIKPPLGAEKLAGLYGMFFKIEIFDVCLLNIILVFRFRWGSRDQPEWSTAQLPFEPKWSAGKFLLKFSDFLFPVERYVDYLKTRLQEGEGESLIEIGVPIQNGGKGLNMLTKFYLKYAFRVRFDWGRDGKGPCGTRGDSYKHKCHWYKNTKQKEREQSHRSLDGTKTARRTWLYRGYFPESSKNLEFCTLGSCCCRRKRRRR